MIHPGAEHHGGPFAGLVIDPNQTSPRDGLLPAHDGPEHRRDHPVIDALQLNSEKGLPRRQLEARRQRSSSRPRSNAEAVEKAPSRRLAREASR